MGVSLRHRNSARARLLVLGTAFLCLVLPYGAVHAEVTPEAAQAAYDKGDYKRALKLWQELAARKDPVAQFSLGVMFERGLGVNADALEAVRYYRASAAGGFAPAQFNLGAAYESGRGVDKNLGEAARWWRKAADQGFTRAQYNLAVLYYYGWGVDKNPQEAARLFELAAAAGDQGAAKVLVGLRSELARAGTTGAAAAKDTSPPASAPDTSAAARAQGPAGSAARPEAPVEPKTATKPQPPPAKPVTSRPDTKSQPAPAVAASQTAARTADVPAPTASAGESALQGLGLPGTDWVRARPADHYTVQMFANWTAESVANFAREHALGGGCSYFVTSYEAAPWYTLLCGDYDNANAARAALDRMSIQVRIMGPWVRSFGDVQRLFAEGTATAATASVAVPAGERIGPPSVVEAAAPTPVQTPAQAHEAPEAEWPPAGDAAGWIHSRDPQRYTIQLFASDSRHAVETFIRKYDLQGKAAWFVSKRDGKPWYSVIYGSFDGYSVAKAAVGRLPKRARKWAPWIRDFAGIQAILASGGEAPAAARNARSAASGSPVPRVTPATGQQLAEGQAAFNRGDYVRALALWRPLVESGSAQAQYDVAFLLETGWAGEQDLAESARLYGAAARQGHRQAQYNLGMLYLQGQGLARDEEAGWGWLRRSAEAGYEKAREKLADGYARGLYGLPRDADLAAYWASAR